MLPVILPILKETLFHQEWEIRESGEWWWCDREGGDCWGKSEGWCVVVVVVPYGVCYSGHLVKGN